MELTFKTYFKELFHQDIEMFGKQIPIDGNKHYQKELLNIQYFTLTPNYNYLEVIAIDRRAFFAVALFWIVLIDQVCYSYFRFGYSQFQSKTMYPKFIGNCTAPSMMSSECGHNQNPRKILQAINDYSDKGNRFDFEREIFKKDESKIHREIIQFDLIIEESKSVISEEVKNYFEQYQPEINWEDFWRKCLSEI